MLAGEPAMIKRAWRSGSRRACVDVRDSERGMIKRPDSRGVMLREHARLSDPCMTLPPRRTRLEQSPAFAGLEDWDVLDNGRPGGRLYQKAAPTRPDQA